MNYPLKMNFKIMAVAPQIFVRDANGQELMYVKQKLFKLKEAISIFSDQSQTNQLYTINAERILDFSARYNFTDSQGMSLGAVKRRGMRSIWKASYDVLEGDSIIFHIQEENAFVKVMDGCFGEIPILRIKKPRLQSAHAVQAKQKSPIKQGAQHQSIMLWLIAGNTDNGNGGKQVLVVLYDFNNCRVLATSPRSCQGNGHR